MKLICTALIYTLFLFVGTSNAFAHSPTEIRATLASGGYDLAYEQGSALGNADGLALAAEALNAKLILGKEAHQVKTAKRAMKLAKSALKLDPDNAEAQIQYTIAYGLYGRHVSNFTAWRKKLPKKIWAEIDKAEAVNPSDARVQALKGAWHLNLIYRGRGFNVEKRYGANAAQGDMFFQQALQQDQNDIIIYSSYLMLQYALEPELREKQTKRLLKDELLNQIPKNAVEQEILVQLRGVYAGFETGLSLELAEAFINQ